MQQGNWGSRSSLGPREGREEKQQPPATLSISQPQEVDSLPVPLSSTQVRPTDLPTATG